MIDAVIIKNKLIGYPVFPFLPNTNYPELEKYEYGTDLKNDTYPIVRDLLFRMGLDSNNFGKSNWNPFKDYVKSNQKVVIKPNWVINSGLNGFKSDALVTHTSILRIVIDYLIIALKESGSIIIADSPVQGCDWKALMSELKIYDLINKYKKQFPGISISVYDLRKTILKDTQTVSRGDPKSYYLIDLGDKSLLCDLQEKYRKFRVTMYDYRLLLEHHNLFNHEYLVSKTIMDADFIVNLPKLKCHIKAGITASMKNIVGINGHKEYLPHHINGCPADGGDQYIYYSFLKKIYNKLYDRYWSVGGVINFIGFRFFQIISRVFDRDDLFDGGWDGNITIPRTIIDLNNILYYYDIKNRKYDKTKTRKVFNLVDGIVAGEGDGPLRPIPNNAGILAAGFNPLIVDYVLARMVGFKFFPKFIQYGLKHKKSMFKDSFLPNNLHINYNGDIVNLSKIDISKFKLPSNWGNNK